MEPATMNIVGALRAGRNGPNMRSITPTASALVWRGAAWTSAMTSPAESGGQGTNTLGVI
eukprot:4352929-Lingulodinium_polyedra.AAC.1